MLVRHFRGLRDVEHAFLHAVVGFDIQNRRGARSDRRRQLLGRTSRWRSPLPPAYRRPTPPHRANRRAKLTLWPFGNTISLFSIGVTCRFSSSQSLSFTSTAATDWAIPADAQEATVALPHPTVWRCTRRFYSPGLSFQSTGSYRPSRLQPLPGAAWKRRSDIMRPEVLITCFKMVFLKNRRHVPRSLVRSDSLCPRGSRPAALQNVVSLQALFFSIHQQRGPVLQAK